ncbi:YecA family protein [Marinobacterium aestuariivivens]|uniref:YecA family protein n=1 Tax=Marinobacterium aestuariivivens TaxID=1698799 RepID=A0ABW2A4X6_9GAMM
MPMPPIAQPLNDDELDRLEDFLFSEAVSEESLDLIGIHGLFCALAIAPEEVPEQQWLELLFDGEPKWQSDAEKKEITALLRQWYQSISSDLYNDEEIDLPCDASLELDEEDREVGIAPLTLWAEAFMEGVFLHEELWFAPEREEQVAELLLPIMLASDLFDEDEIKQIRKDKRLSEQMVAQIPELLVDLYLVFHAPEK